MVQNPGRYTPVSAGRAYRLNRPSRPRLISLLGIGCFAVTSSRINSEGDPPEE
jgi:hypothetical protein